MKTQQKIKKLSVLLLTIVLVLGSSITTAIAVPGIAAYWPMDYDVSNATGFPQNPYTDISISAEEYPGMQELEVLNDSKDDLDRRNIFYIIVIPNLDTKTATQNDYALTLTLTERNGNAPTVKLAKANYYKPVQVEWTANDGRTCDLFIIATPETRDYTNADYTEASIYYLESLNKVQSLYDALAATTEAVVGGYHPQNFRCLVKILKNFFGTVSYFSFSDAYVSNPPELSAVRKSFSERGALAPEQAAAFFTDVLPYYMDYCRKAIEKPELSSLQVMGSEVISVSDTEYALYLPEGINWKKAASTLSMTATAPYSTAISGTWNKNAIILLDIYARDPATNTVYNTEKGGCIVSSYTIKLYSGTPHYAVTSFQINDRIATIDEENKMISLHFAKSWSWSQIPQIQNSGTSYEFLDDSNNVVAADQQGKIDFSRVKKLRLIEDLTSYAAAGADTSSLYYTKEYTLKLTQGNSSECELLSYSVGIAEEIVEQDNDNTITVTIPYATDWLSLKRSCTASYDATITVLGEEDFEHSETAPIQYRVTAEDGTTYADYTVVVKKAPPAAENKIEAFKCGTLNGTIDHAEGSILLELPAGSSKRFAPAITVSPLASVEPASGVLQDFTDPVTYTVTAQNGATKTYTVSVAVSSQKQENPDKGKYENLLNAIIDKYRDSASDDWEWMQLGIYDNKPQSGGPNANDGFDIAKEIKDINAGSNGTMTDIARLIMLLTSRGYDCSSLAQYNDGVPFVDKANNQIDNLVANLLETKSGTIFGVSFGLCALDMGNYSLPANATQTREALIEKLLECTFDPLGAYGIDEVGMVMYAIAPYQDDTVYGSRVKAKLEEGIASIIKYMREDYTFVYSAQVNSETTAQVICALASCGIDPYSDPRFGDGETTILTQWMDLFATSDGFKHTQSDVTGNQMATYQSCYALQWYLGMLENGGAGNPYFLYYHRYDFSKGFSSDASITSFTLEGKEGVIDQEAGTITVTLPAGTPLKKMHPQLELAEGATLYSPDISSGMTFAEGIASTFIVQAEDGITKKSYAVTVNLSDEVEASGAELYTDTIRLKNANILYDLDILEKSVTAADGYTSIELAVNTGVDTKNLFLSADISYGATCTPAVDGETKLDLTDWTTFVVKSGDGKNENTYRIKAVSKAQAEITSFRVQAGSEWYSGTIDNAKNIITVTGVDDSALTSTRLTTEIEFTGRTCSPTSGIAVDFANAVTYTLGGDNDLASRSYTVTVLNKNGSTITANGGGGSSGGDTPVATTAKINSFSVLGVDGVIDNTAGTITVTLPAGTDVTAVAPIVTVPTGAVVSPVSGQVVNLTSPLTYTVTLGTESRSYTVSVQYERSISQQLWDKVAEESDVADHQVSRSPHKLS